MNKPYSLFPISLHEDYATEESLLRDEITFTAHQYIRDDNRSPYDAWMMATGRDISTLPEIFNLTEAQTEEILDFPFLSPPPVSVIRFCKTLGVHPAHLVSFSTEPYYDHQSVLQAMVEIAKPKMKREYVSVLGTDHLPRADFRECLDAFAMERRKIRTLDHNASPHVRMIVDKMREMTRFDAQSVLDQSLSSHFKRTLGGRASDIEDVCDMYGIFLKEKHNRFIREYADAEKRLQDVFSVLVENGEILFGEKESTGAVVQIIHALELNDEYKNLCQSSKDMEKGALIADFLHPDFLQNAYVNFVSPDRIASQFNDFLDSYFLRKECSKEAMAQRDGSLIVYDKFSAWRDSDKGKEELALLANYYRIRPFLPDEAEISFGNTPPARKLLTGHSPK